MDSQMEKKIVTGFDMAVSINRGNPIQIQHPLLLIGAANRASEDFRKPAYRGLVHTCRDRARGTCWNAVAISNRCAGIAIPSGEAAPDPKGCCPKNPPKNSHQGLRYFKRQRVGTARNGRGH